MRHRFSAAVLLFGLACAADAGAEPILYSESALMTGSLDGQAFAGLVTFQMTADTTKVASTPGGTGETGFYVTTAAGSTSISVGGLASDTFADAITAVDDQAGEGSPTFLFYDAANGHTPLATTDSAFATYGMTTAIGPIIDSPYEASSGDGVTYKTSKGMLTITSIMGASTMTATMISPAAVPEPSSLVLTGLAGLLTLGFGMSRRRVAAKA